MSTEHDKTIGDLIEYHRRKAARLRCEALFGLAVELKRKIAHVLQRSAEASEKAPSPRAPNHQRA